MATQEQEGRIRIKAMCLFVHDGKILVQKGYDKVKGEYFYRVLGGSLNFFEKIEEGLRREIREELKSELDNLALLDVVENLFVYEGNKGHEIVFLYSGDLSRKELYGQNTIHVIEKTYEIDVEWVPIEKVLNKEIPLYPALDWSRFLKSSRP